MKKAVLLSSFIVIGLLMTHSYAQTTLEEYNYVVKGYRIQLESGLDMKKGYELEYVDEVSTNERKATLKRLVKITSEGKIVAYMVIYRKGSDEPEYICIPHPSSDKAIRDMFWKSLHNGEVDSSFKLQLIAFLFSRTLNW